MREVRPSSLVKCSRSVDRVQLKRRMDALGVDDLEARIVRIVDPFLRAEARKLARAAYVA